MNRQTILLGAALFVLLGMAGFYAGFVMDQPEDRDNVQGKFSADMNVTANSDNEIATVQLNKESFNLMHEDRDKAIFYIDLDRDGSFDIELDGLKHDGETHNTTRAIGLANATYEVFLQYRDDTGETGDSWITVYRVEEK